MAVFIDPFLLTLTLVLTILMILGNLYFLAHYSHYADSGFGSSAACKFVIVSRKAILNYVCIIDGRLYDCRSTDPNVTT